MASPISRVRLRSLVREELRSLPRNTFALAAVAAVFGILSVPFSFLYAGEAGLRETLALTWLVLPLVVSIVVASRVAGARRTRFVDSLYTTPLQQSTWIAAQSIVGATLGLLVLAVQVPFLLVFVAWLGVPDLLLGAALAAIGVAAFAVALGLFCGVVVGDSSPLAAAGLAGGLSFVSFILFMVHSAVLDSPPTSDRDLMVRLTSLSPLALAGDAAGLGIVDGTPVELWRPIVGISALVVGLGVAAWLAYVRAQGPLGWEARRGRAAIVALVALAVTTPIATAEVDFEESGDGMGYVPGENTWLAFTERGAPIHEESFEYWSIVSAPPLPVGRDVDYDLLVLVLSPPGSTVRGLSIEVKGSDVVRVVAGGSLYSALPEEAARVPAQNDDQPRPVYRVPVTLRAVSIERLDNSASPVEVRTEFTADGRQFSSVGRAILHGKVPGVEAQLVASGLILPGAALAGLVLRKRSTR